MKISGGCYCGAIRYEMSEAPDRVSLCHCRDCQKGAGAPMVSWAAFKDGTMTLTRGKPKTVQINGQSIRSFCGDCGTGLFFHNVEFLPGIIDVQTITLDDPQAFPPVAHIQTAEQPSWMADAHSLPAFLRFPGQG
jgi:hypothetical protein